MLVSGGVEDVARTVFAEGELDSCRIGDITDKQMYLYAVAEGLFEL